ncbi:flagellar basal body P-ring formation protein FlgA [Bradyrhizobium sp. WYCCWR 13023]|uniref:Flagellar basal body P-ring formation protein FlgA n=1 Tax=Bradyrhizobium zhengyangense TaxID=2911009 RepID=A0A9X1UA62_9BRAD|nr:MULTISPECIES: flagellar basal body P-ring formation chaperone FlgA [Bradyrhizobium]MCG2629506.1 flagellar basal body P-ring formation protein FlgA [Bradyrhizobium zhengyangense]MCG2643839.1 flagellar basal body P-ring formation protein FlgA [Bradyrhizobium zhengyangense]MCG2671027.1 flagellar basal body P-ring formation protein FlgA [Bradyrhizobium zhengyangense]MDA9519431.1 flagellar basal body P-ring biosynthesis protein FlgA [Bradyrhizobium sp. CCBAU 11434]
MIRTTLATISALLVLALPARAADDDIAAPTLRASVTVTSDVVRVGDLIDNAGAAAQIPVYRSPDLGTTGALPVAQVLNVLRAKQVIGVMTGDIREVQVTRLARTLANKDLENAVASALDHRFGLGDAANITVTFDRGISDMRLEASNTGALQPVGTRYDARGGRFDISFEINNDSNPAPTKLRLTGTAIETVEVAVLTRDVDRTETLKSSDVALERRPKAEVTGEAALRERAIGMQLRRPMRAGMPIRVADVAKPEFVSRDQSVTVIYQVPGIYLTTRGKAIESGAEGDTVSVLNLQTKRTLSGVVTGRGQVTVQGASQSVPMAPAVEQTSSLKRDEAPAPVDTEALVRNLVQAPASQATQGQAAQAQVAQVQIPQARASQAQAK